MATINPDAPFTPYPFLTKESSVVYGAVGAFTITTLALMIITVAHIPIGSVGYSLISAFDFTCLTAFAIAFIRHNQKFEAHLGKPAESVKSDIVKPDIGQPETVKPETTTQDTVKPETVEITVVDDMMDLTEAIPSASSPFMQKLIEDLNPLMDAVEEFGVAYMKAYYRSERTTWRGSARLALIMSDKTAEIDLRSAGVVLKGCVRRLLSDKQQLLRFAVSIIVASFLDVSKICGALKRSSDADFLKELPSLMVEQDRLEEGFEEEYQSAHNLFTLLANKASTQNSAVVSHLNNLRDKFSNWSKASKAYEEVKYSKNEKAISEAVESLSKPYQEWNTIRDLLFDTLFMTTNFEEAQICEIFEQIIPPHVDKIKDVIFSDIIPMILNKIPSLFEDDGFFSDSDVQWEIYGATSAPGRGLIQLGLPKALNLLPMLDQTYKNDLCEGIPLILAPIASPFYYGTCDFSHRFRQKIAALVNSVDFKPPQFPLVQGGEPYNWTTYLKGYTDHLAKLTSCLDALSF